MTKSSDRFHLALLLVFYELCFSIALIPSPTTRRFTNRQTFLFGCLLRTGFYIIHEMTTGSPLGDIAVGSIIGVQALIALDGIYLTDPNGLKNLQEPPSGRKITEKPLLQRIRWTFELYTNTRGIGWEHEPSNLPARPSPTTSTRQFVLDRLATIVLSVVFGCIACVLNASNPGLTTPNRKLSESDWIWRVMTVIGLGLGATAIMNTVHAIVSVISVGFGLSIPERWPNLFGSPFEAWNIQNIWRKVWHQMLRKQFLSATHFILVRILGLPPLSHTTKKNNILEIGNRLLWIYIPFFISGVIHMAGEYMFLGRMAYGAMSFFLLQAVGITLEKLAGFLLCRIRPASGRQHDEHGKEDSKLKKRVGAPFWIRCVGFGYVVLWFSWSLAFYVDPMVNTDVFVCPQCDLRVLLAPYLQ